MDDLDDFTGWLRRTRSPRTIDAYLQSVRRFQTWLGERGVSGEAVDRWMSHLSTEGNANSSIARHFSGIKAWFRFQRRGWELEDVVKPRAERHTPVWLTAVEALQLIEGTASPLHKAAFALQYGCGLRFDELRNLLLSDLDVGKAQVAVLSAKQGGDSIHTTLPVHPAIMVYIVSWLEVRPDVSVDYLFCHHRGGQLDNWRYNLAMKAVCRAVGLKEITSHALRHSIATHMVMKDTDAVIVQTAMRHQDPGSTKIYTHLSPEHLKAKLPHPFE